MTEQLPLIPEVVAAEKANLIARLKSSESVEWFTPAEIVEAGRDVLGGVIDIDPASCAEANTVVKARRYFAIDDDGLTQSTWANPDGSPARLFANCPFGGRFGKYTISNQKLWTEKLLWEWEQGHLAAAVWHLNSNTEASYYQALAHIAPVCLPAYRISFWGPDATHEDGKPKRQNTNGSAWFYLGPRRSYFAEVFSRFGIVQAKFEPVRQYAVQRELKLNNGGTA